MAEVWVDDGWYAVPAAPDQSIVTANTWVAVLVLLGGIKAS